MIVNDMMEALRERCAQCLEELHLPVQPGRDLDDTVTRREAGVFIWRLPEKTAYGTGLADKRAPYLLIQLQSVGSERDSSGRMDHAAVVRIFGATYGSTGEEADQYLALTFERLRLCFADDPIVGKRYAIRSVDWIMYNDNGKPLYAFGEMDLEIELPSKGRREDFAFLGPYQRAED